ncbi:MAG: hypothetical protein M0Z66_02385 [Thermaerobacter sp.]|nr:hypothetical protein [Thermaerobacter sp.]
MDPLVPGATPGTEIGLGFLSLTAVDVLTIALMVLVFSLAVWLPVRRKEAKK